MTLAATEFIRRFMMHVLPSGFVRIRHFGFLANMHRNKQLRKIRELMNAPQPTPPKEEADDQQQDFAATLEEPRCPHCQHGTMCPIYPAPRPRLIEVLNLSLLVPPARKCDRIWS